VTRTVQRPPVARVVHLERAEVKMAEKKKSSSRGRRSSIKNEKQYEALKRKGMSKERAAKISNAGKAGARKGGRKSGGGRKRR
jgi:hypothetical protein